MALNIKLLAGALLSSTANQVFYTLPAAGKSALVKSIFLVNNSGTGVSINLMVRNSSGSAANAILPGLTLAANSKLVIGEEITLAWQTGMANSDRLEIWAGTTQTVHCVVCGLERDI